MVLDPGFSRTREAGNLVVGNLSHVRKIVSESAEAAAENNRDRHFNISARANQTRGFGSALEKRRRIRCQ